jgi:hypothetical protein
MLLACFKFVFVLCILMQLLSTFAKLCNRYKGSFTKRCIEKTGCYFRIKIENISKSGNSRDKENIIRKVNINVIRFINLLVRPVTK